MENFKDLLQKLHEVHEREVEVLQVKVKELSNKKGCDTKRMEELFTRNQQMKEQHRLLTENIKTLENRLRAGLCDRCTVTQEVAKRRHQEYEASRIQSLQHISLLAGEMTNLRKENLKLKDDITNLRAMLESRGEPSVNNSCSVDITPKMSPDLPPSGAVALVSPTISSSNSQPADSDVRVKTEADHRGEETECRQLKGTQRSSFEVYKPHSTSTLSSWKTEHRITRAGERSFEALDQHHAPIHPSPLRKKSPSSPGGEVKPSRPVIHAPIPCHPKRLKSGPVSLPWPADWVSVAAAGTSNTLQTSSSRLHLPHFTNLIPPSLPATPKRHTVGSPWQKPSTPLPPKEPTVVFTFRRMPDNTENETRPPEKKEDPPSIAQKISGEALRGSCDGPLDLSDHAKSKPNQPANDDSPIALQCQGGIQRSPDRNVNMLIPVSSPSLVALPSSSSTTQVKQQEQEPTNDHNHEVKDQQQKEEAVGKTEQSNRKNVPVLTLSLRPVVRLETLTSALHKQESISSNGKPKCPSIVSPRASSTSSQSSSSANEAESSLDEQEDKSGSGQETKPNCKRKRPRVETETDRDSDTNKIHQDRRIKITVITEKRSPN